MTNAGEEHDRDGRGSFDEWAQKVYLSEVALQCLLARRALAAWAVLDPRHDGEAYVAILAGAQSVLTAAAALSKLFFPLEGRAGRHGNTKLSLRWRKLRGDELQRLGGVDDSSPLFSRTVRDGFEHMDEKLDRWLTAQPRLSADAVEAHELPAAPQEPGWPARSFAPDMRSMSFYGDTFDIGAVAEEIDRISARVEELRPGFLASPRLHAMLAALPPWPPELRLDTPTRRPNEHVLTGVQMSDVPSLEDALRVAVNVLKRLTSSDQGVDGSG